MRADTAAPSDLHRRQLLGWRHRDVEYVKVPVAVGGPDFPAVGRHRDAMAGRAMAAGAGLEPTDLYAPNHFAGRDIADFETEQAIHDRVDERAVSIDRERPHRAAERSDLLHHLMRRRIRDPHRV